MFGVGVDVDVCVVCMVIVQWRLYGVGVVDVCVLGMVMVVWCLFGVGVGVDVCAVCIVIVVQWRLFGFDVCAVCMVIMEWWLLVVVVGVGGGVGGGVCVVCMVKVQWKLFGVDVDVCVVCMIIVQSTLLGVFYLLFSSFHRDFHINKSSTFPKRYCMALKTSCLMSDPHQHDLVQLMNVQLSLPISTYLQG